jgi:ribosomal protein S6--L-glutamate ligase
LATDPPIAIGARLARFSEVLTLGVRPNLEDYPPAHRGLIRRARTVYYPTQAFAAQLQALGKRIFPSLESHLLEGDKIKQTIMLGLAGLPHPRTRVFYGSQRRDILRHFAFPFVAKTPRASAGGLGVFLIRDQAGLEAYLAANQPAYIQELLPLERDLRVVCINYQPVCCYWRWAAGGDFRTNLAQGGRADFDQVPAQAVELAVEAARACRLDDVGVDLALVEDRAYVLEFNVKYGHKGAGQAGLDLRRLVVDKILAGEI